MTLVLKSRMGKVIDGLYVGDGEGALGSIL